MSYEKKLLQMKALVKKNVPKEEPKKKDSEVTLPFIPRVGKKLD